MADKRTDVLKCDYCGVAGDEAKKLFSGANSHICDICVCACADFVRDLDAMAGDAASAVTPDAAKMKPEQIKKHLDEHVVGQEEAKMVLSVATYNHYKRVLSGVKFDVELQKSNVLLLGPTGSGKTLLASALAKVLDVPFAVGDATRVTQVGFIGPDAEDIIGRLLLAAGGDPERAARGIVYIDEIDKLAIRNGDAGAQRSHQAAAQFTFLKMIEGTIVEAPTDLSDPKKSKTVSVDTSQILFIFGGAFVGLRNREGGKGVGFLASEQSEVKDTVTAQDLVNFGLIPEFVGRIPVMAQLEELDCDALVKILTQPKNALLKQYQALLSMDDVELRFTDGALKLVAQETIRLGTGARGLRAIIEKIMLIPMFEAPGGDGARCLEIDESTVQRTLEAGRNIPGKISQHGAASAEPVNGRERARTQA